MRIFSLKLCMITIIMLFNSFILLSQTVPDGITLAMADPLDKILKERTYFPEYKYQADVSGIIEVSCNTLPGGDSHIIYPGHRKLFSSLRMEAMRDGIVDYELFLMLEAKNPEQAREIAKSMISGFQLFDGNIKKFREKRRELLQCLEN